MYTPHSSWLHLQWVVLLLFIFSYILLYFFNTMAIYYFYNSEKSHQATSLAKKKKKRTASWEYLQTGGVKVRRAGYIPRMPNHLVILINVGKNVSLSLWISRWKDCKICFWIAEAWPWVEESWGCHVIKLFLLWPYLIWQGLVNSNYCPDHFLQLESTVIPLCFIRRKHCKF